MASAAKVYRWGGGICLVIALLQMVLGFTVLHGVLEGKAYLFYWSFCILTTVSALFFSMLDFSRVKGRWREEQQALIQKALEVSEEAARNRRN